MSKRGAVVQIDKDGKYLNEVSASHLDDNDDQLSGPQLATAEVMSKRKILKPRSKNIKSMGFGSTISNNAFSNNEPISFSNNESVSLSSAKSVGESNEKFLKIQALNEQFVQKIKSSMNESQNSKIVDFSNLCEKYIEYIKSINGSKLSIDKFDKTKSLLSSSENHKNDEKTNGSENKPFVSITPFGSAPQQKFDAAKNKSFGFTFGAKPTTESKNSEQVSLNKPEITKENSPKPNPFSFLGTTTNGNDKDLETGIKTGQNKPMISFKPAQDDTDSTSATQVAQTSKPIIPLVNTQANPSEDESDEEESKPVKVEGPAFTISAPPTTNNSVFSFKAKKPKVKSDSDSESEVEIKGPSFNFTGSVKSAVFNLPQKPPVTDDEKKKDNVAFLPSNGKSNASSLKAPEESAEKAKPSFTFTGFGSSTSSKPSEPIVKAAQPVFDISSTSSKTIENISEKSTNAVEKVKENGKPTFAFSFGNNQSEKSEKVTPLFSSKNAEETKPKPAFSFGFGKPASNIAENSDNKKETPTSFGNATASSKPTFSFGTGNAQSNAEPSKPAPFNFGSSSSFTSTAPSFSFGQARTNTDSIDNTKEEKTDQNQIKPSQEFSFSLPFQQSKTSFSSPSEVSVTPSSTFGSTQNASKTVDSAEIKQNAPVSAEAEVDEPSDEVHTGTNNKVVVAPPSEEETEDVLYQNRAKLMLYVPACTDGTGPSAPSYSSQGIGEIKLLKDKTDPTKVRFLLRSDGMGNILLNTYVLKKFTYGPLSQDQENLIKIPVVDPSSNSLKTYVLKVKQKADGRRLTNTIKDAQEKI